MPITFEVFQHTTGETRWRLRTADGRIVADSGERDVDRDDALLAMELLGRLVPSIAVEDLTDGRDDQHVPPYNLGELPEELDIQWPEPPTIEHEETIRATNGDTVRCDRPHTRYVVQTDVDDLIIAAADVVVAMADDTRVGSAYVEKEVARVHFDGGRYGEIELAKPVQFMRQRPKKPLETWRSEWLVEDVLIEGVDIDSTGTALNLRGKRIAVLSSQIHAGRTAIWVSDTACFSSEDIIVANNELEADGPEATVRIQSTRRSVVVDNVLTNSPSVPQKHNYRVHKHSDLAFAARNTLVHTGLMIAGIPRDELGTEDVVGTVWFLDNVIHYRAENGLLVLDEPLGSELHHFVASGNTIYRDDLDCFLCLADGTSAPDDWDVAENTIYPYQSYSP